MGSPAHAVGDDVGHLPRIGSIKLSELRLLVTVLGNEDEVAPKIGRILGRPREGNDWDNAVKTCVCSHS